jgi:transcriptional regulator with XRE-family HTH domain
VLSRALLCVPVTANQLIAYNLRRARRERDLTQEQAAERLEPFLGRRWSGAVFSAAETSVHAKRIKVFSADEILAFSRAFDFPVAWFFLPPHENELGEEVSTGGPETTDTATLIEAAVPALDESIPTRLRELAQALPGRDLPLLEERMLRSIRARWASAVDAFLDAHADAEYLREIAQRLDQARWAVVKDFAGEFRQRFYDEAARMSPRYQADQADTHPREDNDG